MVKLRSMDKQKLRQALLVKRVALTAAQVQQASAAICQHLAAWPTFQNARTVMAYLAFNNEVSLQELIDAHPEKVWVLPRTLPAGRLTIHRYQPERLTLHRWGILQPAADAPLAPLAEIELVLAPGVGFDKNGGRLGFGGGYYDRLLPKLNAISVGISHQESCVPAVPCNDHDCQMDWLALPDGLVKPTRLEKTPTIR